jgi:hypothetical protein
MTVAQRPAKTIHDPDFKTFFAGPEASVTAEHAILATWIAT